MRILHIVINGIYSPGLAYLDNLLPKYHVRMGNEVFIMASCQVYDKEKKKLTELPAGETVTSNGETLIRVPFRRIINSGIAARLRLVPEMEQKLERITPDFIMLHGVSTLSIPSLARYMKKHKEVRLIIDNHADFSNSAMNPISHYLLHRGLWRCMTHIIAPYTETFYGVIPARVDFLRNEYRAPKEKCALLLMGADDDLAHKAADPAVIRAVREKYQIDQSDFLIVTGGAINASKKQTLLLMQAVRQMTNKRLKLLIFGSVSGELRQSFDAFVDGVKIQNIGWLHADDTYPLIAAADLAVYPGRHSTLWEQTVGQGIPMICKYWDGTTHVDIGGNVRFLYQDSAAEIREQLEQLLTDPSSYKEMKKAAGGHGREQFLYGRIAEQCLARRGA